MQVRNTVQRKIILDIMKDNFSHPTAEEIYETARSIDGHISRGTVYRNLGFLSDTGEILKIRDQTVRTITTAACTNTITFAAMDVQGSLMFRIA